jgi:RimJ/RimL family protein N-acetyltransferase
MAVLESRETGLRDGTRVTIRSIRPDEVATVIDYLEAVSGESDNLTFGPGEFGVTTEQEEHYLRTAEAVDGRLVAGAYEAGELVGMLSFSSGTRPRLRHAGDFGMSVRRAHWGRGIGAALLTTLIDWARGTGVITKVNLRVRTSNARAINLYARHGSVPEGTATAEVRIDGQYFDNHLMGLRLE